MRKSSVAKCYVVSVKNPGKVCHLLVVPRGEGFGLEQGKWQGTHLDAATFPSIEQLVDQLRKDSIVTAPFEIRELSRSASENRLAAAAAAAPSPPRPPHPPPPAATAAAAGAAAAGAAAAAALPAVVSTVSAALSRADLGAAGREELRRVLEDRAERRTDYRRSFMRDYIALIRAMMGKKLLSMGLLDVWRDIHGFGMDFHNEALEVMRIRPEDLERLASEKKDSQEKPPAVQDMRRVSSGNSRNICVVCLDRPRNCLFLDCRHLVCCMECGAVVQACPVCRRALVDSRIRVFS